MQIETIQCEGKDLLVTVRMAMSEVPKVDALTALRRALVRACLALDRDAVARRARLDTVLGADDRAAMTDVPIRSG